DGIRDFHVTGVQTCALPISQQALLREHSQAELLQALYLQRHELYQLELSRIAAIDSPKAMTAALSRWQEELRHPDARVSQDPLRSEERRVGQESRRSGSTCH